MKFKINIFSILSISIFLILASTIISFAYENATTSNEDIILSDDEYFKVISELENISYAEAKEKILSERLVNRSDTEQVVNILKTVEKKINNHFTLKCSAYLEVAQDKLSKKYIEILNVRAPYVDLSGVTLNSTMSGSLDPKIENNKTVTIFCNGSITYTISKSVNIGADILGVNIGEGQNNDWIYRYDVHEKFRIGV